MKQFTHCVMDSIGIHARPAGLLARAVKAFDSTVVITKADGRSANASRLPLVQPGLLIILMRLRLSRRLE